MQRPPLHQTHRPVLATGSFFFPGFRLGSRLGLVAWLRISVATREIPDDADRRVLLAQELELIAQKLPAVVRGLTIQDELRDIGQDDRVAAGNRLRATILARLPRKRLTEAASANR